MLVVDKVCDRISRCIQPKFPGLLPPPPPCRCMPLLVMTLHWVAELQQECTERRYSY